MKRAHETNESMAAYLAGRLSPEETAAFGLHLASDASVTAEADGLGPVAEWLAAGFKSGPSSGFRLSADRLAVIRATARGDIVEFPIPSERAAAYAPRRAKTRWAEKYALAVAAMVAMMIGGISGFESGRFQFAGDSKPVRVAIAPRDSAAPIAKNDTVYLYPPAYSLDRADFAAMRGDRRLRTAAGFIASRDYGLPGPHSPYLREREILFLQ